ncbi:Protein phosphatase 1G [Operophtera brumata]|uniref:protein-serine/threonine phosphatase n=1 Tax=Operophtera brumata TaxID=104452 RepID=A0A0L7KYB6_OPEBR|nr:Protein phosphatase 1G [Operophtera brumata]
MSHVIGAGLKKVVILSDSRSALQHVARCASGFRAKYENKLAGIHRARLEPTTPLSPCLRAKKNEGEAGGSGASSSSSNAAVAGSSSELDPGEASSSKNGVSEEAGVSKTDDDTGGVSSTNNDKDANGEVSTSEPKEKAMVEEPSSMEVDKPSSAAPDSSGDNVNEPEQSADAKAPPTESKPVGEDENITSSNGAATPAKGKGKASPVSSSDKATPSRPKKTQIRRAAAAVYQSLLRQAVGDDDDESDSNDENFEGEEVSSDENINGDDDEEKDGEEVEEEEEEDEEEESSTDEDEEEELNMQEEPGNDSGCTAVVALLRGSELFVANAGDSRCIICREGKAVDMSIDHKPEDAPELDRITKAGGKVSNDGRVNGGLNLSRAIGDHAYKLNKELGPREQMITALPDVKTLTIDNAKDQFMVLACDGIWNFMSSQDMFDHCLAPSTMGDGTGCDNMTAIIVKFKDGAIVDAGSASTEGPKKRPAEEDPSQEEQQESKRQKVDDPLSSSLVTSSV